jgi:hypothetical protein
MIRITLVDATEHMALVEKGWIAAYIIHRDTNLAVVFVLAGTGVRTISKYILWHRSTG